MITLKPGPVSHRNATVKFGGVDHEAEAHRDAQTGDIAITVETDEVEPKEGMPLTIILHGENDGTYHGVMAIDEEVGVITFTV